MYPHSLRAAASSSGGARLVRFSLGRSGGAVAAPGFGRSFSATPAASAPVQGARGVGMEQSKQQQQPQPQQDAVHGDANTRDGGAHKGHWDPITHSFGEGYWTRAEEEGFGGVYARGDDDEERRHSHPEYDTSQGCEVREKEKGRHFKDEKHAN